MSTNIGRLIKQRREELGLTQGELAEKMGYTSKSTINKIEMGKNDVNQTKIEKFADVLSVPISYLLDLTDNKDSFTININSLLNNNEKYMIMCLSNIIKTERIKRDITEKTAALNSGLSLEEYLKLENEYRNIGIDKIVRILLYLEIEHQYLSGFLKGFAVTFDIIDYSNEGNNDLLKETLAKKCVLTKE